MKRILFISHDAYLTGAPVLLLNLIKLLIEKTNYEIFIIIKNGQGVLIEDFKKYAKVQIWKSNFKPSPLNRLKLKFFNNAQSNRDNHTAIQEIINKAEIIFSNTITNGDFFKAFKFRDNHKIISYIHELEIATEFYTNKSDLQKTIEISNHFVVPSKAVGNHLTDNLGIDSRKIFKLNYFIPFNLKNSPKVESKNTFVIGLIGTYDWRKGSDILTVLVGMFFKKYPTVNVKFYWKGAQLNSIECERTNYELNKLNLAGKVTFFASSKDVEIFYTSIDLLLLLSKEDPYPLVVLEAASYEKPCICFESSGGAPEFIESDAGDIVPYLDLNQLIDTLFLYYTDREKAELKGKNALKKYINLHNNKELIIQQFNTIIEN